MNTKLISFLITIGLASAASMRQGQDASVGITAKTPVLLELFTSEGCSSCPPADALLQQLDATQPVPGAQLIVLSEHVDYWDHEGWKDLYSSAWATERQNEYVRQLRLQTPYTPQFVVDGTSEFGMGKEILARQAFEKAVASPKVSIDIGSPKLESKPVSVLHMRIYVDGTSERHNAEIYVAVALDHAASQVSRGENSGKRLTHVAVAEELKRVGKLERGRKFERDVDLKLKPDLSSNDVRIVVFVQEPGPGKIVGVAARKIAS